MERADYMLDLHSGGSSLDYVPSAILGGDLTSDSFAQRLEMAKRLALRLPSSFRPAHLPGLPLSPHRPEEPSQSVLKWQVPAP